LHLKLFDLNHATIPIRSWRQGRIASPSLPAGTPEQAKGIADLGRKLNFLGLNEFLLVLVRCLCQIINGLHITFDVILIILMLQSLFFVEKEHYVVLGLVCQLALPSAMMTDLLVDQWMIILIG
jgi:hypothetical protein